VTTALPGRSTDKKDYRALGIARFTLQRMASIGNSNHLFLHARLYRRARGAVNRAVLGEVALPRGFFGLCIDPSGADFDAR